MIMNFDEVIIVNQSAGYLTVDICNAFARRFKKVTLLAGSVKEGSRPLSDKVEIFNITPYRKQNPFKRLQTWWKAYREIRNFLKKDNGKSHVVFFTNPPISYMWMKRLLNDYMVVEYDIYPDILRNTSCPGFIINYWSRQKEIALRSSKVAITLGDSMKRQLSRYIDPHKIKIVSNWADVENPEKVAEKDNPFVKEIGLEGKFIVMYSGNLGLTHNVETLIDVAQGLQTDERIRFLVIGQGPRKKELENKVKRLGLNNVVFHDLLPIDKMKYSFGCASLGVVTLTPDAAQSSVPSKTYNLLSYGIPILNISSGVSELKNLISKYKCGKSIEKDNIKGIRDFITKCVDDKDYHVSLSEAAKSASVNFTFKNAERYVEIYDEAL